MFKHKKKKTGCETPEFRSKVPMPPVRPPKPPTSVSNAVQPSPPCTYSTPCGWCCKWDKKCDKKIGCNAPLILNPKSNAQEFIDEVKSSKLPPIGSDSDFGLQTID